MLKFSVFSYLYRDGANFKAWGELLLKGMASATNREIMRRRFESGELFIAEQLGIPALYAELWAFSNGATEDDHVWHTFDEIRAATAADMTLPTFDSVEGFIKKINVIEAWDTQLSPHWDI